MASECQQKMLTGKHMNQQAEIHIFINYSDLDKIRTDLKFNSAKVAGYLRYYKCKANSEGISKMTSNERQKKIICLLDKRRKDTMEHLSIEFHVSTDTISRDIATLNEDYPIKIARGRNGGLSLPDGYHLFKKMYMTPVQALALHRALLYVPDEIKKMGIQCKMFSPILPVLSTHYNNRDHRKILVIDGKVGFTGGVNIGDEYINRRSPFGHWKDTAIMLEGDGVEGLTQMFLQMWNVTEKCEDFGKYLQKENCGIQDDSGFILPFGDSPFDRELIGETVYMDIINRAEDYVHIMTPYLIIDHEMETALCYAAKRGVDVKLILPHIPDKKMPFALAKTHYPQLLKAGVRIFEYTPGFVHAKVFSSDGRKAVVGTINLDYRSLFLHFECGVFMYKTKALMQLKEDCMDTFAASEEMTLEFCRGQNVFIRIFQGMMRLFAPLL